MRFPKFPFHRQARLQRLLRPEIEKPKYTNPYFKKIQPSAQQATKSWLKKDGWAWGIALVLLVGGLGFFLLQHSFFQINSIDVQGTQRISADEVKKVTQSVLDQKILGYIPKSSYWVLRTSRVENALRGQLTQSLALGEIKITKHFPNSLTIQITEQIPSMNWVSGETWYVLDPNGVILQAYATPEEVDHALPTIIDLNQTPVQAKQSIVTPEYVLFLRQLQTDFSSQTGLGLDHFEIPVTTCQQKKFIAEQAIQDELSQEADDTVKTKIRAIQERFQSGEIDIDQSLQLIEEARQTTSQTEAEKHAQQQAHIAFKAQYVAAGCDLKQVLTDVAIRTSGDQAGFLVYVDSTIELSLQLENLKTVLREKVTNPKAVSYIDVRYTDRAYIK